MKYLDPCKPLYEERGNAVSGRLVDEIERIHKEGGGEKDERSKGDNNGGIGDSGEKDTGEVEEREGAAFLEDASENDKIYGAIPSRNTTTTNTKAAKDSDDEEGRMVGILQFWVCAMGHMEAIAKLITERDIECLEHLTGVTFREFEEGNVTKV